MGKCEKKLSGKTREDQKHKLGKQYSAIDYLKSYQEKAKFLLEKSLPEEISDHVAVYITWDMSLKMIEEQKGIVGQWSREILTVCSYLATNAIPQAVLLHWFSQRRNSEDSRLNQELEEQLDEILWFSQRRNSQDSRLNQELEEQLDEILLMLQQYSLISCQDNTVNIHPILHTVIRSQFSKKADEQRNKNLIFTLIESISKLFTYDFRHKKNQASLISSYFVHAKQFIDHFGQLNQRFSMEEQVEKQIELLINLACYSWRELFNFDQAFEYLEEGKKLCASKYDEKKLRISLEMGHIYLLEGNYDDSEKSYKEIKCKYEEKNLTNDQNYAVILHQLGNIKIRRAFVSNQSNDIFYINSVEEAFKFYYDSFKINFKILKYVYLSVNESDHPILLGIADNLHEIASIASILNNIKSINLIKKALFIKDKLFYKEPHEDTAISLFEYSLILKRLNQPELAKKRLKESLAIYRSKYPESHEKIQSMKEKFMQLKCFQSQLGDFLNQFNKNIEDIDSKIEKFKKFLEALDSHKAKKASSEPTDDNFCGCLFFSSRESRGHNSKKCNEENLRRNIFWQMNSRQDFFSAPEVEENSISSNYHHFFFGTPARVIMTSSAVALGAVGVTTLWSYVSGDEGILDDSSANNFDMG